MPLSLSLSSASIAHVSDPTPVLAQAAGGDIFTSFLLPMAFIFAIMYFLIIRPQSKRAKEHANMLAALKRGDTVITGGGLVAKITRVHEEKDEIEAEISQGVQVRLKRQTIIGLDAKTEPAAAEPSKK